MHPAPVNRVLARIRKESDGCWIYTGALVGHGYGRLKQGRRTVLAHRMVYEAHVGPIPEGMELDHLCRRPACVNPAHLEPVSHAENVRRGESGQYLAERDACSNGHPFTEANTYYRPDGGGRGCRECRRNRTRKHRTANVEQERARCREYYHRHKRS